MSYRYEGILRSNNKNNTPMYARKVKRNGGCKKKYVKQRHSEKMKILKDKLMYAQRQWMPFSNKYTGNKSAAN